MTKNSKKRIFISAILVLIAAVVFIMVRKNDRADASAPAASPGQQQAMPVKVIIAEKKLLRIWTSFAGHTEAVDYVELRPQVSGRIDKINFEDGQIVHKNDVLFIIDPRPYQASVTEAEAAVAGAKNRQALALKELERAQGLIKADAISQRILDERQNTSLVAKNELESAEALLAKARVDLDHANLKAPISGKISRAEITAGNLVEAGPNAPVLSTIVSDKGIYADFQVDEQTYLQNIRQQVRDENPENRIPVELVLNSDAGVPYQGYVKSFDNRIDATTGTIRVRSYFDNKDGTLLPGMFVNVKMASPAAEEAILLTEQAIGTDQDRKFVYVVDDKGKVIYREVKLGTSIEGERVIASGLEPGEKVVVEGLMKLHPDMIVAPQTVAEDLSAPGQAVPLLDEKPATAEKPE